MKLSDIKPEFDRIYPPDEMPVIEDALRFVLMLSGSEREINMLHLLNVARILAAENADYQTIVIALLHHMLEDCIYASDHLVQRIDEKFGNNISHAVASLTMISDFSPPARMVRLSQLHGREDGDAYRLRVIGVKIACRLDRMRNLSSYPVHKQHNIARETRDLYVNLAVLMGMYCISDELKVLTGSIMEQEEP